MQTISQPAATRRMDTKKMVMLALFAALAYLVCFLFRIPVVAFLKYEPKDVLITIAAFLYGPLSGMLVSVVVSLVEMITISTTGPIGMLMNVISTCAFAGVAGVIYQKRHTLKGAIVGLLSGTVTMIVAMLLWNYLITPLYLETSREAVTAMLLPVFLPFNVLKSVLNSALILLLYKPLHRILGALHLTEAAPSSTAGKSKGWLVVVSVFVLVTCIYFILVLNGTL